MDSLTAVFVNEKAIRKVHLLCDREKESLLGKDLIRYGNKSSPEKI